MDPVARSLGAIRAQLARQPLSVLRHTHEALQRVIGEELDREEYDIIHAEQVQSIFNIPEREAARFPGGPGGGHGDIHH